MRNRNRKPSMQPDIKANQNVPEQPIPGANAAKLATLIALVTMLVGVALLGYVSAPAGTDTAAMPSSSGNKRRETKSNSSTELADMIERAEKYLHMVDDWAFERDPFEPLTDVNAARAYLQDHPRMSKYASSFSQVCNV